MSSGAPWSVKGIDPKAREIAKDLARREGLTLGDWLNRIILEDPADEVYPTAAPHQPQPSPGPIATEEFSRLREALDRLGVRVESAEHRSTLAISGIDQTVLGLLSRLETAERDQVAVAARFEGALDEVKTAQAKGEQRVAKVEELASQPRSVEALRALEAALGKVATHLYDSETKTREALMDVRQELGGLSQNLSGLGERVSRLDESDLGPSQVMIDGVVSRIVQRLEEAEARTSGAIRGLEGSISDFDQRLQAAETRAAEAPDNGAQLRLEQLAADLTRNFDTARDELAQKQAEAAAAQSAAAAQAAATTQAIRAMTGHMQAAEKRSTQAIERMGHEVLKVADGLGRRMEGVETRNAAAIEQVGGDVARIAEVMEGRVRKADQVQAESMERLGSEIARITERLAERIANAERRSAQAIDDVGEQVSRITERLNQRQERSSADLAERIRLSEERTARLLDEARDKIDQRLSVSERRLSEQVSQQPASAPPPVASAREAAPSSLFAEPDLPPGPFDQEMFNPPGYGRRATSTAGFVPLQEETPEQVETSPFEADDFDAAAMFDAFNSESEQTSVEDEDPTAVHDDEDQRPSEALELDEEVPPAAVEAAVPAVEPHPRASTRELIAQARAAARSASQAGDVGTAKRGLFGGLSLGGKKGEAKPAKKPASKMRMAMSIAAGAAVLGVATAGLTLYSAQVVSHPRSKSGAGNLFEIVPGKPSPGTGAPFAPQAALALAPQVIGPIGPAADASVDLQGLYADAERRIGANDRTGVAILRRAANLGYPLAQFDLAKLYETGDAGLPKDVAEARRWTERAAENGERRAMHNLALYYFEGTGGAKNLALAAQWFRRAADLGLIDSQYNLARLYEGGFGVIENHAEAYKWYLIAARSGDGESRNSADRLKRVLSPEGQKTAEHAAASFRAEAQAVPAPLAPAIGGVQTDVALAQRALSRLGYYRGPADGAASPALKLAIASFQKEQGLPQTGVLDPTMVTRLSKAAG